MFQSGDLVRIKKANSPWEHLLGTIGIFVDYETNTPFPCIIKPLNCAYKIRFDNDDLEYICSGQKVTEIIRETKHI